MLEMFKYTDKEITKLLKSMTIIIDSNEQVFDHISTWFDKKKIPYVIENLDFCDYSFYLPTNPELGIIRNLYFDKIISIERKRNLEEISTNFGKKRIQFENEFIRATGKIYLLIENASYEDIINKNYKTELTPQSFIGSLHSFADRYNFSINFMKDNKYSAQYIYYTMYYFLRNYLMNK